MATDRRQRADLEAWREAARQELRGKDPETLAWETAEGLRVKPLYTAADLDALEYTDSLPGLWPYLRGPRATMYANRPWTIRQYAGYSTAEESNAFYRRNLAAGQKGLSVASTSPPTGATTPTIRAWWATSARPASPSTRSRT